MSRTSSQSTAHSRPRALCTLGAVLPRSPCTNSCTNKQTQRKYTSVSEGSGREWGTIYGLRKGEGKLGVLSAPLPLLAQEDP
eukprot:2295384-Pyramimonas_sp.AAC.1